MITSLKQWKIKFKLRIKLNHNRYIHTLLFCWKQTNKQTNKLLFWRLVFMIKIGKKGAKTDLKNFKSFPNCRTISLVLLWGTMNFSGVFTLKQELFQRKNGVPKDICATVEISWELKYEAVILNFRFIVPQRTRAMVRKFGKLFKFFRSVLSLLFTNFKQTSIRKYQHPKKCQLWTQLSSMEAHSV